MAVHQAFRYELDPTARQRRLLAKAAGTARYAFNWGLVVCKRRLDAGVPVLHAADVHRLWRSPETQTACGAEGPGQENGLVKPAAAKQESPSRKLTAQAVGYKRL